MLILPKVPHSLRSLTQSFARSLNPSSGGAAQPSVTFSSQGSSVHVIGGGGPFTHNSALLGGGALTRTGGGSSPGTGIGFENWAPASGGGGGAGAGSRNAGAGSYGGYTGHARALIQSTPSASTDPTSLLDDDDAELQSALSSHRLRVRQIKPPSHPHPRPDRSILRPQNDEQLKIIRRESIRLPEVQRRLRLAFAAKAAAREELLEQEQEISNARRIEAARMLEVEEATATAPVVAVEAVAVEEVAEEAEDQVVDERGRLRLSSMEKRERGRSITPSPLIFLASSSPLGKEVLPSSSSARSISHQSTRRYSVSSAEEVTTQSRPELDASLDHLLLSPRGSPITKKEFSSDNPFTSIPPLDSLLTPSVRPETSSSLLLSSSSEPLDQQDVADEAFIYEDFEFDTLGSINTPNPVALPFAEPTSLSSSVPINSLDAERRATLENALRTRDISIVIGEVDKYIALPPSDVVENGIQLPQQTTKTYNTALRAMCSIRPPGAPVSEIVKAYSGMVAQNVAPDVETYSIVIRILCEREVEIQEAFAFEKELRRIPLLASHARSFRAPPNLLPLPSLHTFVNTPDFSSLKEERNLDQAISLFTAASSFRIMSTHPFPIEAYDALLKACAKSGRAQDALSIFVNLEEKVGKEGGELGMSFKTWQSMVEVYGRQGAMDASEDVFEEYRQAEMDGRIVIREGRERHIDSERIVVWNSLVDAYFKNGNPLRAIEIVESLTAPPSQLAVSAPGLLPLPVIQASTLTSIIQGFIQTDDLDSALSWFKRIVPEGENPAPTGLPPLEPIAFVSLLSIASRIRDHDMYDLVFDRFTAHPPRGYHFRPVELAEAIHLHLAATENPMLSSEQKDYHLDRIFHFVERCDRHERSKYLYPPSIAGSLLHLLIEQNRSEAMPDVYSRALRSGQENETDPLAAVKFHAYFFESVVHWVTTPTQNPLNLSIVERLRLVATLVKIADAVDVPTDLTASELAPRILHLYLQAKREVNGDLRLLELDNNFVTMIMHTAGLDDLNLLKDPETAHLAAASATFVHDIVELQHATETRFNVDWTFGARAVVACQGVETAIEVLRPLGDEVLYLSGAVPRPSIGRFSRLNPDVPSFIPGEGSAFEFGSDEQTAQQEASSSVEQPSATQDTSNPLPPSSEYESTAVSTADASEYEQSQTSISTSVPTSEVPATLGIKLLFDQNLSELVDLHHRSDSKVSPLQSYAVLQDGLSRGYTPSVSVLGHLIMALGRLKDTEKANEVLELAHNVLYAADKKDLKGWFGLESSAIVAFAHCGEMDRANFHRHNIIQNGGKPSADGYAALINGAKDTTDDASIARELFQEALSVGTKPHLFLYNTVISSLSKARKAEEALALFYAMQDGKIKPNTVSYGAVINGCCRVGDIDTASRLFDEMTEQPNFKARVPPFNTMMQYYTTAQPDRSRVLFYYDELVNAGVQPSSHTYNLLMLAYGTIEPVDLKAMEKVFSILRKKTWGETSVQGLHYATLINCHGAVARDLEKALAIFDSIAGSYPNPKKGSKPLPDAVCWEAILNVILVHKRFDLFEKYTQRMHESGIPSTTYIQNVLIKAYSAEGKIEKAREVFEAMENPRMGVAAPHGHEGEATEDGKVYHQPSSYEAMIRAELGAGNRDRAADLCNMMEGRMYPLSVTSRIRSILGEADAGIIPPSTSAWLSSA